MSDIVAETKRLIESLVSRPRPSDKALSRPPFRFIYDLVVSVNAKTGFIEGLLEDDELTSDSFKSAPEKKVAFLKKLVKYAEIFHKTKVQARVKDIVGGHEVEKTHLFLQQLLRASQGPKEDFPAIVQQVRGGKAPPKDTAPREDPPEAKSKDPEEKKAEADSARKSTANSQRRRSRRASGSDGPGKREPTKRSNAGERRGSKSGKDIGGNGDKSAEMHKRPSIGEYEEGQAAGASVASAFDASLADGSIQRTQELFQGLIQRPTMKERYLQKPPFRFIHDIISEVTRVTGLAEGLFGSEFADAKQITTKEGKLAYLNQLLEFVSNTAKVPAPTRASKVASGQDPENTNKLLQFVAMLGRCKLENKPFPGSDAPTATETAPTDGATSQEQEAKVEPRSDRSASLAAEESKENEAKTADDGRSKPAMPPAEEKAVEPPSASANALGRPQTARKRPPKIKDSRKASIVKPTNIKATPALGVMMEGDDGSEEEEDDPATEAAPLVVAQKEKSAAAPAELQGKLVRDIINEEQESKSEEKRDEDDQERGQKGIQMGRIGHSLKKKSISGNTTSAKQLDQLKDFVQTLCQSTNPLGKCVDFVHEDYSTMAKELEKVSRNS